MTNAADIWTYGLTLWEMISLSVPHNEELDENESFDNSVTETNLTDNQFNDSKFDMDESITFLKEIMPRTNSKYGK